MKPFLKTRNILSHINKHNKGIQKLFRRSKLNLSIKLNLVIQTISFQTVMIKEDDLVSCK